MSSLLLNKKKQHYWPLRNVILTTSNNNILMAKNMNLRDNYELHGLFFFHCIRSKQCLNFWVQKRKFRSLVGIILALLNAKTYLFCKWSASWQGLIFSIINIIHLCSIWPQWNMTILSVYDSFRSHKQMFMSHKCSGKWDLWSLAWTWMKFLSAVRSILSFHWRALRI